MEIANVNQTNKKMRDIRFNGNAQKFFAKQPFIVQILISTSTIGMIWIVMMWVFNGTWYSGITGSNLVVFICISTWSIVDLYRWRKKQHASPPTL